jgi:hypothetical protein
MLSIVNGSVRESRSLQQQVEASEESRSSFAALKVAAHAKKLRAASLSRSPQLFKSQKMLSSAKMEKWAARGMGNTSTRRSNRHRNCNQKMMNWHSR